MLPLRIRSPDRFFCTLLVEGLIVAFVMLSPPSTMSGAEAEFNPESRGASVVVGLSMLALSVAGSPGTFNVITVPSSAFCHGTEFPRLETERCGLCIPEGERVAKARSGLKLPLCVSVTHSECGFGIHFDRFNVSFAMSVCRRPSKSAESSAAHAETRSSSRRSATPASDLPPDAVWRAGARKCE